MLSLLPWTMRWRHFAGWPLLCGPDSIVVTGESAGAGLAAATLLWLRDEAEQPPLGAYLISPFADLTLSGTSVDGGGDPVVDRDLLTGMAASYLQREAPQHPYLSPVWGHFGGCPPILLHAARDEALIDDTERLAERVRTTGGAIRTEYSTTRFISSRFFRSCPRPAPLSKRSARLLLNCVGRGGSRQLSGRPADSVMNHTAVSDTTAPSMIQ